MACQSVGAVAGEPPPSALTPSPRPRTPTSQRRRSTLARHRESSLLGARYWTFKIFSDPLHFSS